MSHGWESGVQGQGPSFCPWGVQGPGPSFPGPSHHLCPCPSPCLGTVPAARCLRSGADGAAGGRGDHQQREPRRGEHRNHAALQLAAAHPLLPHPPLHQGERRHRGAERELPHSWGAPGRAGAAGPPPHPSLPWQSAEQGAVSTLYCAISEEVSGITGKYFDSDCGLVLPSAAARDAGLARKLWEESERLTGLSAGPQN